MIQTFRDAEIEIRRLQDSLMVIEKKLKGITTMSPQKQSPPVQNITNNYPLVDPVHRDLIANIPTLATGNAGYLFYATDYEHLYRWNGTGWEWGPGDCGSGYYVAGGPQGGQWGLCDGGIVTIALENGGTTNITTPDLTGDIFILGATSESARKVSTRATWEATAKSADEVGHEHFFNNGGTPTGGPIGAATTVQSGTGATVASDSHYHNDTSSIIRTQSGEAHSHNLTDALSQLKKFDETSGGLPLRISLVWYIRK